MLEILRYMPIFSLQETMEDIDKNKDKKISLEEYIGRFILSQDH